MQGPRTVLARLRWLHPSQRPKYRSRHRYPTSRFGPCSHCFLSRRRGRMAEMAPRLPNRQSQRRQARALGPLLLLIRRLCTPLSPVSKKSPEHLLRSPRKLQSSRMGHPKSFKPHRGLLPSNHHLGHRHRPLLLRTSSGQMVWWDPGSLLCFRWPTPKPPLRGNLSGSRRISQMPAPRGRQIYSTTMPTYSPPFHKPCLPNRPLLNRNRRNPARHLCQGSLTGHCHSRS